MLYSIASHAGASCTSAQSPGSACVFNDVVKGNISVPCQAGSPNCSQTSGTATGVIVDATNSPAYSAAASYDLATGLGSVNGANLVNTIAAAVSGSAPTSTTLTLNGANTPVTAAHGAAINVAVGVDPSSSAGEVSLLGSAGGIDSSALNAGAAAWTSKLFPGGTYAVKAHYAGDATHGASDSNPISVTINPEASKSFVNLVTFNPQTGAVSWTGNNVPYGSPYVLRADVTDASGSVSSGTGVTSTCATHVASCATGKVSITSNGSPLDAGAYALNSLGFAEDQAIQLPAGNYTLGVAYPGDASYSASNGSSAITIAKAISAVTAPMPSGPYQYGAPINIMGRVTTQSSGVPPTGTMTLLDNGVDAGSDFKMFYLQGAPPTAQNAAYAYYYATYSPHSLGTHTLTVQYSGDQNYNSSAAPSSSITVTPASAAFVERDISLNASTPTIPVSISATFSASSGTLTGTITFYDNGNPISGSPSYTSTPGSIAASLSGLLFPVGNHVLTVSYSGDANTLSATGQLGTLPVYDKLPTQIPYLNVSRIPVGQAADLTTGVASPNINAGPAITGTVTFLDGTTPMAGGVRLTSQFGYLVATLTSYTFTTPGTHTVTVQYGGDSTYASASNTFSVDVLGPLAIRPFDDPNYTMSDGGSGVFRVNVLNNTTASMAVTLACAPNPTSATCSFSPATVNVPSNTSTMVNLNFTVPANTSALRYHNPFTLPVVFAGVLMGLPFATRRRRLLAATFLVVLALLAILACGGGGSNSVSTPPPTTTHTAQTYKFTVTATSGTNTDSQVLTVTVP